MRGEETTIGMAKVTLDVYNWERKYKSTIKRLKKNEAVQKETKLIYWHFCRAEKQEDYQ